MPYGNCLIPLDAQHRDTTDSGNFGNGTFMSNCVPEINVPHTNYAPKNTTVVNNLEKFFFIQGDKPQGSNQAVYKEKYGNIDLQTPRPEEPYASYYVQLAAKSLNVRPDYTLSVFFSDENINHLRNTVVQKVKEITSDSGVAGSPEGVTIKAPNMDDFFYYMVNIYQNYKINNGSICFMGIKKQTDIQQEVAKLNTDVLQEYISKMISQINMYIYYYKDASQLPEQLSLPSYTSMKGSRTLEYNTGFTSGNSLGVASYNEANNIM
jgi:hypothetical protein